MLCEERQMSTSYNDEDERIVFVRNLDEKVSKEILEELFIQMGTVVNVVIKEPKFVLNGPKSVYAFVEFQDPESVLFAVEMLDDIELYGKKILVAPRAKTFQAENYKYLREQFLETRTFLTTNTADDKNYYQHYQQQPFKNELLKKNNYEQYSNVAQSFSRKQNTEFYKTKKRGSNFNNKNLININLNQNYQSNLSPTPLNRLKFSTVQNFNNVPSEMPFLNKLPPILKNFNFSSLPPKGSHY